MMSTTNPTKTDPDDFSFTVSPNELDSFAEEVATLRDAVAGYAAELAELRLDDGVFGRLPGISSKVYGAYARHTEECAQAFSDGRSVLGRLGDRTADAATAYRDTEAANVELVAELAETIPLEVAA